MHQIHHPLRPGSDDEAAWRRLRVGDRAAIEAGTWRKLRLLKGAEAALGGPMLSIRTAILALVALILVALFILRGTIGRNYPGVPAYYSFDSHAFTFNVSYTSGSVGPFTIGSTKAESITNLANSGLLFRLPMAMTEDQLEEFYFKENSSISNAMREVLLGNSTWRISTSAQGATVVYKLVFNNDRLVSISLTSTLAA